MRMRLLPVVVLFSYVVLAPARAYAWLGDGWIEKLSGPGPFHGLNIDLRLICIGTPDAAARTSADTMRADNRLAAKAMLALAPEDRATASLFGCHFLPRDERRLELGFQYNRMSADGANNPLDYSHRPGVTTSDRDVDLSAFLLTADLRVNRIVDVGASIGRAGFSSPSNLFGDFSRVMFQPIRVTVRPLSPIAQNSRLAEVFLIRADGTMFKGGFTDVDFDARPGTFSEPGEIVWGWSLIVDVSTLFWSK